LKQEGFKLGAISNYLENALINAIFRNLPYTSPTTVYAALYTSDPTDTDVGTEVSGGGYVRQPITFGAPNNGVASNSADVVFPVATADWGTITHFGIRDAETGGNLLYYGPLTVNKTILAGDQLIIKTGNITVSLD